MLTDVRAMNQSYFFSYMRIEKLIFSEKALSKYKVDIDRCFVNTTVKELMVPSKYKDQIELPASYTNNKVEKVTYI